MTTGAPDPEPRRIRPWEQRGLLAILIFAAALRVWPVTTYDFWLDEFWTVELSTGRGSVHLDLPLDAVIDRPPKTTQLDGALPWHAVWTSLERVTHPPLYFLSLRCWRAVFGGSDAATRSLSVVASLAALVLLWDVARRLLTPTAAIWAAAFFAVAWPQVEYAQQARNYALLTFFSLGMLWAIARMRQDEPDGRNGWTVARGAVLFLATLATLLTHYFAAGTVAGMFVATLLCLRGKARRFSALAMIAAGIAFLLIWGPWMWEQRIVFRTTDPTTAFLVETGPAHFLHTAVRLVVQPALLLAPLPHPWRWVLLVGSVVWLYPLIFRRSRPELLPPFLWMAGTLAVVALLDLTRSTKHLEYPRYTLLAAPGAYLVIASLISTLPRRPLIGHSIGAALTAGALATTLLTPREWRDFRALAAALDQRVNPGDVIVFASPDKPEDWAPAAIYLGYDHYSKGHDAPVLLLRGPLSAESTARLKQARILWLINESEKPPAQVLPGFHPVSGGYLEGYPAGLWQMR